MTLEQWFKHFAAIYGQRNIRYLPNPAQRLAFLNAGLRLVEDAYEENQTEEYSKLLASAFARWTAMVELLPRTDAVMRLAVKYGTRQCAYCQQAPCACPRVNREDARVATVAPTVAQEWSIRDWQNQLGQLYGAKNAERGMDFVLRRLFSESVEVANNWLLCSIVSTEQISPSYHIDEMMSELCDVLAWILAAATLLHVDLEAAVAAQYGNGCPSCRSSICACPPLHQMVAGNGTTMV